MSEEPDIARLEDLVLNSAPARAETEHNGWLVRHTVNDVKRARSVAALSKPKGGLEEQIAWCERLYAEAGIPPLFRLSPASEPQTLDDALAAHGYEVVEPTLVQVRDLSTALPALSRPWEVAPMAPHLWVNAVGNFREATLLERQSHLWRLRVLGDSIHLLAAFDNGSAIGTGAVVIDDGYAGILDMQTREDYRGEGVGTAVLEALLSYAINAGAHTAWLGVLAANEPALGLYEKFSFETVYQYWYRQKPTTSTDV